MTDISDIREFAGLSEIIRKRHSERVPFDPERHLAEADVLRILESARWAPTAHNMQNFEIIVVDDTVRLAAIGQVRGGTSEEFIRENYAQLSFSEEELIAKGTGLLATMFPPSWRDLDGGFEDATDVEHGFLNETMRSCPLLMIVVYDRRKRAPASKGDFLGTMSLGCVMQNMWLTAETLGIGMQIMSVFSAQHVERELRKILSIPDHLSIAFACRLGYPAAGPGRNLRVRRQIEHFAHHNTFAAQHDD